MIYRTLPIKHSNNLRCNLRGIYYFRTIVRVKISRILGIMLKFRVIKEVLSQNKNRPNYRILKECLDRGMNKYLQS